jgi:hypothetical protein
MKENMKRKRSTKMLPRKFEPAVPGNVKLKLPITNKPQNRAFTHVLNTNTHAFNVHEYIFWTIV